MKKKADDFNGFLAEQLADPDFARIFVEEKEKLDLAIRIHELRAEAGISQKRLAEMIGTTQSVIARMENPEYSGYSLRMLRRIAAALGRRVKIEFVPLKTSPKKRRRSRNKQQEELRAT